MNDLIRWKHFQGLLRMEQGFGSFFSLPVLYMYFNPLVLALWVSFIWIYMPTAQGLNIVAITWGERGHAAPMYALATELSQEHHVVFASHLDSCRWIQNDHPNSSITLLSSNTSYLEFTGPAAIQERLRWQGAEPFFMANRLYHFAEEFVEV